MQGGFCNTGYSRIMAAPLMGLLRPHSPKTRAIICHKLPKIPILKPSPVDDNAIEMIVLRMAKRNVLFNV